jgi:hypothetical protein
MLSRDELEAELPTGYMSVYLSYRTRMMRFGYTPDPPLVWMQTVPPLEVDLDKEHGAYRAAYTAGTWTDSFDAWLDDRHEELRAQWRAEQQGQARFGKSTFAQWLDDRLTDKISASPNLFGAK